MDLLTIFPDSTCDAQLARESREVNRQLSFLLRHLRYLTRDVVTLRGNLHDLAWLAEELRDELALHFSLEEAQQVFEQVALQEPRLYDTADTLQQQHVQLYAELCRIAEELTNLSRRITPISRGRAAIILRRIRRFDDLLQEHEAQELDLVHKSLNVDIGVGD